MCFRCKGLRKELSKSAQEMLHFPRVIWEGYRAARARCRPAVPTGKLLQAQPVLSRATLGRVYTAARVAAEVGKSQHCRLCPGGRDRGDAPGCVGEQCRGTRSPVLAGLDQPPSRSSAASAGTSACPGHLSVSRCHLGYQIHTSFLRHFICIFLSF